MAKRVGVILSGCGVFDGSEIHEAVATLLALDRAGAEAACFAPAVEQMHTVNHVTGDVTPERRNVLVESARIARGRIADLATARASDLDGAVFPGGFGAAKNLCDFATRAEQARAHPDAARLVRELHAAGKPLAFLCIAPALAAAVFRETGVRPLLTIGTDATTARAIEAMGARHQGCAVDEIAVDREHRIVSAPCYMLANRVSDVFAGAERAVRALLEMA